MMVNRDALEVLSSEATNAPDIVAHDWWVYQVVSSIGGQIFFDKEPSLLYRQHSRNEIGARQALGPNLKRASFLFSGVFSWKSCDSQVKRSGKKAFE